MHPIHKPTMKLKKAKDKNFPNIITGVPEVNSFPDKVNSRKILYKTIHTASFTTPSPNNIANNLGSLSS